MVEECKRRHPHGGGREQVCTDGVGGQGGEKRRRVDLEGRGRYHGALVGPWKIKKAMNFPNNGIDRCM